MLEPSARTPERAAPVHSPRSATTGIVATALAAATLLAAVGCGSRPPPETEPTAPEAGQPTGVETAASADRPSPRTYTVQPGDTLWSLARRFGVTVNDFVAANDLADPDNLSVGEQLIIPEASASTPSERRDPASESTPRSARPVPNDGAWMWPVPGGMVLSEFGARRGGSVHRGLDIDATPGEPVVAAWAGVVVFAGGGMRDYGNAVIIDHGNGVTSLYGHNAELLVRQGERVNRGQPIARAGDTGNATTVHCHFEVRRYDQALDPMEFLSGNTR